jgi:hypothetical protein
MTRDHISHKGSSAVAAAPGLPVPGGLLDQYVRRTGQDPLAVCESIRRQRREQYIRWRALNSPQLRGEEQDREPANLSTEQIGTLIGEGLRGRQGGGE